MSNLAKRADEIRERIATAKLEQISTDKLQSAVQAVQSFCQGNTLRSSEKEALQHTASALIGTYQTLHELSSPDKETMQLIRQQMGDNAFAFISHDQAHISHGIVYGAKNLDAIRMEIMPFHVELDPELFIANLLQINKHTDIAKKLYEYTWELIRNRELRKEGTLPVQYSQVRPLALNVASAISARFSAHISNAPTPGKTAIIIEGDMHVAVGASELTSIIYNNFKNSNKKFMEKMFSVKRARNQEINYREYLAQHDPQYVTMRCVNINDEYAGMIFSDSGTPVSLDLMINRIAQQIRTEGIDAIEWFSPSTQHHFARWSTNPYAFNQLTAEDITNTAFMANITGDELASITSGMGLYGTQHIMREAGGAIIYTTTLKQTPVFLYILPKKEQVTTDPKRVRDQIIDGLLTV